jgi:hypothetical protein
LGPLPYQAVRSDHRAFWRDVGWVYAEAAAALSPHIPSGERYPYRRPTQMLSHTVPKKLLEQFAYFNPFKRSLWLWRYEKDRAPYPNASPRSATQVPNHFSHPDDSSKEAEIERRLGREFESLVNDFLFEITRPGFSATDVQRRQLTLYVTLLFLRSEARRKASAHTQEVIRKSIDNFLSNESQLLTVVAAQFFRPG